MKLLIDCSNLLYAAFHTTGQLTYEGHPTGIIFGFLRKLLTISKELKPDNIIFTWDSRKSLRKMVYPDYKKKRHQDRTLEEQKEFEEAIGQFNEIREKVLPTMGFRNSFRFTGYEADDIIAEIVLRHPDDYYIVSSDHDLYQLLSKSWNCETKIYTPTKGKIIDIQAFHSIYGIPPSQWAMAKAIGGCDGDGVDGIPGVGDPGKSPGSGAIRYLKGLLKEGSKVYDIIESDEGKRIIARNLQLVALPFDNELELIMEKDQLTYSGFKSVFEEYGFSSFKVQEWGNHFQIEWDG
jgi:DNA polymerase-1